jgi:hypothetical protein
MKFDPDYYKSLPDDGSRRDYLASLPADEQVRLAEAIGYKPGGSPQRGNGGGGQMTVASYLENYAKGKAKDYLLKDAPKDIQNALTATPATPEVVSANRIPLPDGAKSGPNGESLNADGTATDPSTGQIVGKWAQGAAGAYMIYDGYNRFKNGDKVGGGLEVASGAATAGNAAGIVGGSVAAPIAGAYGAYQLGSMAYNSGNLHSSDTGMTAASGAVAGAGVGAAVGALGGPVGVGAGAAIGAVVGGLYGATLGLTASHKDKYQVIRDKWRDGMKKMNTPFFTQDYKGMLADGTVIDWNHIDGDQGQGTAHMHFEDPTVAKAVAYGGVLATAMGARGKAGEAITGEIAKAALANANGDINVVKANMLNFAKQMGMEPDKAIANIDGIGKEEVGTATGTPEENKYQVLSADAKELFGLNSPMASQNAPGYGSKQSNGKYWLSPGVYSNKPPAPQQQPQKPVYGGGPLPITAPQKDPGYVNDLVMRFPPGGGPSLQQIDSAFGGQGTYPRMDAPQKQSNGKFRVSPGIYSDSPPPLPLAQVYPGAMADGEVKSMYGGYDGATQHLQQMKTQGLLSQKEYDSALINLGKQKNIGTPK